MNAWMELVNGHCFRFQSVFPLEFKKRTYSHPDRVELAELGRC